MLSSLLLSFGLLQTPAAQFTAPFNVAETQRLAISPKIDGMLADEEWDELSNENGVQSFFEWEPRVLNIAAKIPANQDMIISLDMKPNGWLIGRENLEARVSMVDGKPKVTVRQLDATQTAGPKWIDLPGFVVASKVAATTTADSTIVELSLVDPGIGMFNAKPGDAIAIRVDAVAPDTAPAEPYLPRTLTQIKLTNERTAALPVGLKADAEGPMRVVLPGEATKIRLTFNGTNDLGIKRIKMRTEGLGRDVTNLSEVPFPQFDNKKRAFVDFDTKVDRAAEPGYRVLRGSLAFDNGPEATIETSFRIAPTVDFELAQPLLQTKGEAQKIKLGYFIRSNSPRRLDGQYKVEAPSGFDIKSGSGGGFIVYDSRGSIHRVTEIEIPANAKGTFPIKFTAYFGDRQVEETTWLTIE